NARQCFEPIRKALQQNALKTFNPPNPRHAWALRRELAAYSKWMLGQRFAGRNHQSLPKLDPRLASHVDFALDCFRRYPLEVSGTMRKHQLKLADRQCRMAELSQRVQDTVVMLVTALWGGQQKDEAMV